VFTGRATLLGDDNQTHFARSGATTVRHDCLSKAFWPRHSRLLIFWRPIFATIFLRQCAFQIFASRFPAKNAPELATKFIDCERALSLLQLPPGPVIVSAHSLDICSFFEARIEKHGISVNAGRSRNALPFASRSIRESGCF
jgi:hypothetical protein